MTARSFAELPPWRRTVLVVLVPLVLPAVALVMLGLLLALAWNGCVYGICWLKWKIWGTPIPSKTPPQPPIGGA